MKKNQNCESQLHTTFLKKVKKGGEKGNTFLKKGNQKVKNVV